MFRAVVRGEGFRKSTLILGGALSAAVHLFLAAAVLLPLSGAPLIARAELDGPPPVLTLDDPTAPSVPATAPAVPQANTGAPDDAPVTGVPAPQAAVRRPRRPPPLPPPPPDPTADLPPAPPPPAAPKSPTPLATAPAHVAAAPTQIVSQSPRPGPLAATRPYLSPGVASGLRIYDNFPRMPDPLRGPGVQYVVLADVCVSERGVVDRVRVSAPAGAAALEHALTDAIRTWRYRPLITRGSPSPFCHMVNMRYALE